MTLYQSHYLVKKTKKKKLYDSKVPKAEESQNY